MELSNKSKVIICVSALSIAFGFGYFAKPTKVVTKVETKEVTKEVKTSNRVNDKNKVITITKVVNADGSSTTHTTIEDRGKVTESDSSTKESIKTASTSVTATNDIGLTIQALAIVNINDLKENKEYGIYAKKRVFSNVSVGILVTSDKKVGVGLGLDF